MNAYLGMHMNFLVYSPARVNQDGRDTPCIDNEGFARTSSAVDAKKIQGGVANNLPLCTDDATNTPSLAWWLWVIGIYCFYGINAFGILYPAILPLEYADAGYRVFETMPYIRRLAAVSSLWGVSVSCVGLVPVLS